MSQDHIVIAGAGVIGLTIAHQLLLQLQQRSKCSTKKLTIISQHFPSDEPLTHEYTSAWAGAHFRPFPHRKETYESDKRESAYTRVTYEFFKKFAREHPESTIEFMKGIDWVEAPTAEYTSLGPGYSANSLTDMACLPQNELPQGVNFGCEYLTYCLNAPIYLKFLQRQVEQLSCRVGVDLNIIRTSLLSLKEIKERYPEVSLIFNATGQGLQYRGQMDPQSYGIRGQTLLLNVPNPTTIKYANVTITHQGKNGLWTFVIKRPASSLEGKPQYILGGTKQLGDNQTFPRASDTEDLLTRARKLYPDLMFADGSFDVVRTNVGFRPARNGGSRVETELVPQDNIKVVHAYGLGGMGYETSVGVAQHALKLSHSKVCKL